MLTPSLESIERFCETFRLWRAEACAELDLFSAELLLREVLTNSVLHGCVEDSSQSVSGVLRVKAGRLLIAIEDDGQGFDWRALWEKPFDESDTHGRGISILRHYANSVRFNAKGNAVMLIKRFSEKTYE